MKFLMISILIGFVLCGCNKTESENSGCYEGSFVIENADDVDEINSYTCLNGDLHISSTTVSAVRLENLITLEGALVIVDTTALTSVRLDNLTSIKYVLSINNNSALNAVELPSLANSESINGIEVRQNPELRALEFGSFSTMASVRIIGNPSLPDLRWFGQISSVSYEIVVEQNGMLSDLRGLEKIVSLQNLHIVDNASLLTLNGLDALSSIDNSLLIERNPSLADLNGLGRLEKVGRMELANNDALANLNGLGSLFAVDTRLEIFQNDALADVDGLTNLVTVGISLSIADNPALKDLGGIRNLHSVGESLAIDDNLVLEGAILLDSLVSVPGRLSVSGNPKVVDLSLRDLVSVKSLHVDDNENLETLDLSSLSAAEYLTISNNTSLPQCTAIDCLDGLGAIETGVCIRDNLPDSCEDIYN